MTREEAIKVIRKMLAYTDLSDRTNLTADMVNACHLAIKALEHPERNVVAVVPCGDCISRADVNQVIEDYMDEQYHVLSDRTRERAFGANAVMARINELPSVTPQLSSGTRKNSKKLEKDFGESDYISRSDAIHAVSEALKHTFVEYEDIANKVIGKLPSVTLEESTTKNDLAVDAVSRKEVINQIFYSTDNTGDVVLGSALRKRIARLPSVAPQQPIHGKCNQCKYYEGVHNVQGHAPCTYHRIGGVMWDWYCSQFNGEVKE